MDLKDLVLNVNQAKNLIKLGLNTQDAWFMWTRIIPEYETETTPKEWKSWSIERLCHADPEYPYFEEVPTYTLQEILEKFPDEIVINGKKAYCIWDKADRTISYNSQDYDWNITNKTISFSYEENALNAAYKMLCWLLENGYYGYN